MSVQSAIVSWSCVRPTSKTWFLKIIQATMKHDPFGATYESNRLYISILREVNLDRLHCLFHQWECLKFNGHGLSVSCVKWPSITMTWSETTLNYWMVSTFGLLSTWQKNLLDGQLPHVLWCRHVGLLSQKKGEKKSDHDMQTSLSTWESMPHGGHPTSGTATHDVECPKRQNPDFGRYLS